MRKGEGLFQVKIKASFLQNHHKLLSSYFLVTENFPICPMRKPPAASQVSSNHHLFLMGYADTMSPGQARPVLRGQQGLVPNLAPPALPPACQWEGSRG